MLPFSLYAYKCQCTFVFGRELLDDTDSRVAYYSSAFLLKVRVPFLFFFSTDIHALVMPLDFKLWLTHSSLEFCSE